MGATAGLVTVAEFERMKNPRSGSRLELHHGEVVEVPPPKKKHSDVQIRLNRIFINLFDRNWQVMPEFPFNPGSHEIWVADLAVTPTERWAAVPDDSWFAGVPELVVEVLSPSNTATEINDRESICLDNGCREFWVIDPDTRQIRISTPDRLSRIYRPGDHIPLGLIDAKIAVDDILPR